MGETRGLHYQLACVSCNMIAHDEAVTYEVLATWTLDGVPVLGAEVASGVWVHPYHLRGCALATPVRSGRAGT